MENIRKRLPAAIIAAIVTLGVYLFTAKKCGVTFEWWKYALIFAGLYLAGYYIQKILSGERY